MQTSKGNSNNKQLYRSRQQKQQQHQQQVTQNLQQNAHLSTYRTRNPPKEHEQAVKMLLNEIASSTVTKKHSNTKQPYNLQQDNDIDDETSYHNDENIIDKNMKRNGHLNIEEDNRMPQIRSKFSNNHRVTASNSSIVSNDDCSSGSMNCSDEQFIEHQNAKETFSTSDLSSSISRSTTSGNQMTATESSQISPSNSNSIPDPSPMDNGHNINILQRGMLDSSTQSAHRGEPIPSRTIGIQCDLKASSSLAAATSLQYNENNCNGNNNSSGNTSSAESAVQASSISSTRFGYYSYSHGTLERRRRDMAEHDLMQSSASLLGKSLCDLKHIGLTQQTNNININNDYDKKLKSNLMRNVADDNTSLDLDIDEELNRVRLRKGSSLAKLPTRDPQTTPSSLASSMLTSNSRAISKPSLVTDCDAIADLRARERERDHSIARIRVSSLPRRPKTALSFVSTQKIKTNGRKSVPTRSHKDDEQEFSNSDIESDLISQKQITRRYPLGNHNNNQQQQQQHHAKLRAAKSQMDLNQLSSLEYRQNNFNNSSADECDLRQNNIDYDEQKSRKISHPQSQSNGRIRQPSELTGFSEEPSNTRRDLNNLTNSNNLKRSSSKWNLTNDIDESNKLPRPKLVSSYHSEQTRDFKPVMNNTSGHISSRNRLVNQRDYNNQVGHDMDFIQENNNNQQQQHPTTLEHDSLIMLAPSGTKYRSNEVMGPASLLTVPLADQNSYINANEPSELRRVSSKLLPETIATMRPNQRYTSNALHQNEIKSNYDNAHSNNNNNLTCDSESDFSNDEKSQQRKYMRRQQVPESLHYSSMSLSRRQKMPKISNNCLDQQQQQQTSIDRNGYDRQLLANKNNNITLGRRRNVESESDIEMDLSDEDIGSFKQTSLAESKDRHMTSECLSPSKLVNGRSRLQSITPSLSNSGNHHDNNQQQTMVNRRMQMSATRVPRPLQQQLRATTGEHRVARSTSMRNQVQTKSPILIKTRQSIIDKNSHDDYNNDYESKATISQTNCGNASDSPSTKTWASPQRRLYREPVSANRSVQRSMSVRDVTNIGDDNENKNEARILSHQKRQNNIVNEFNGSDDDDDDREDFEVNYSQNRPVKVIRKQHTTIPHKSASTARLTEQYTASKERDTCSEFSYSSNASSDSNELAGGLTAEKAYEPASLRAYHARLLDHDSQCRLNESGLPEIIGQSSLMTNGPVKNNNNDNNLEQVQLKQRRTATTDAAESNSSAKIRNNPVYLNENVDINFGRSSMLLNETNLRNNLSNGNSKIGSSATMSRIAGRSKTRNSLVSGSAIGSKFDEPSSDVGGQSLPASKLANHRGSSMSLVAGKGLNGKSIYETPGTRTPVIMYIPPSKPKSELGMSSHSLNYDARSSISASDRHHNKSSTLMSYSNSGKRIGGSRLSLSKSKLSRSQAGSKRSLSSKTNNHNNGSDSESSSSMLRTLLNPKQTNNQRQSLSGTINSRKTNSNHGNKNSRQVDDEGSDSVGQLASEMDSFHFRRRYSVPKDAKINWFSKLKQRVTSNH